MTKFEDIESICLGLDVNYRTDENLLHKINKIFDAKEFKNEFSPLRPGIINNLYDDNKNFTFVKDDICTIINNVIKDTEYKNILILCRNNYEASDINQLLRKEAIPSQVFGGKGLYNTKEVVDIYKIFYFIIYGSKAMKSELEKDNEFIKSFILFQKEENLDIFFEQLRGLFRLGTIENILEFLYNETQIEEYYQKLYGVNNTQEYANLLKIKEIATKSSKNETIQPIDFFRNLGIWIDSKKQEELAEVTCEENNKGLISIMTVHSAKGLEAHTVILANAANNLNKDGTIPIVITKYDEENNKIKLGLNFEKKDFKELDLLEYKELDFKELDTPDFKERIDEEKRVFYVALTRAKHRLIIQDDGTNTNSKDHYCWSKWAKSSKTI